MPELPTMLTPRMRQLPTPGLPWAADTGLYGDSSGYTDSRYLSWLERLGPEGNLFATAPDRWGDAVETRRLALPMLARIASLGFRVAYCLQDGEVKDKVPWSRIGAVFVGGSDRWRSSDQLLALLAYAQQLGLYTHMGRVNTQRRYEYARSLGFHSVDGTLLRYDPQALRHIVRWASEARTRPMLWR